MRKFHHAAATRRLVLPAATVAAMVAGTASADLAQSTNGLPGNAMQHRIDRDRQQRELDQRQAVPDRHPAALDRRTDRWGYDRANAAPRFRTLDADGDGYISKAEANAVPTVARMLWSLDADDDGRLSLSEYQNIKPHMTGAPNTTR